MIQSRALQRAARRDANRQADRLRAAVPNTRLIVATVSNVIPNGAADGTTATVTVTWRGSAVVAAGYSSTYAPGVGHRVRCSLVDDQLFVDYRIVGQP